MPNRYHFDLECGQDVISDETGVAADNLDLATEEAQAAIQDMRVGGELPDSNDHWELVIRDEDGNELKRIPLQGQPHKPETPRRS